MDLENVRAHTRMHMLPILGFSVNMYQNSHIGYLDSKYFCGSGSAATA